MLRWFDGGLKLRENGKAAHVKLRHPLPLLRQHCITSAGSKKSASLCHRFAPWHDPKAGNVPSAVTKCSTRDHLQEGSDHVAGEYCSSLLLSSEKLRELKCTALFVLFVWILNQPCQFSVLMRAIREFCFSRYYLQRFGFSSTARYSCLPDMFFFSHCCPEFASSPNVWVSHRSQPLKAVHGKHKLMIWWRNHFDHIVVLLWHQLCIVFPPW